MIVSTLRHKIQAIASAIAIIAAAMTATSCDSLIYDDLDPCGVKLRFVYDYNMLYANAFPSQVHCLTLFIYDAQGHLVEKRVETDRALLSDENWRMTIVPEGSNSALYPEGTYTVVAYGGMDCPESTFHFTGSYPLGSAPGELGVAMDTDCYDVTPGVQLHHLFYGTGTFEVKERDTEPEREYTVSMIKDTNNLRILLQHVDGTPVRDADFSYTVTTDNTLMDASNALVATAPATFKPWTRGEVSSGLLPDGSESILAFAEFSTGRFVAGNPATLTITSNKDGHKVLEIPLVNYLLLLKSQEFQSMSAQEFLDRESRWDMIFFLDNRGPAGDSWVNTTIVINDWVVRINDIDLW